MKNFGLGVNFEEEDPEKPLGTLKRAHAAIPFNEQDLEAGHTTPDPRSPQSLLGYQLKRRNRINL